MLAIVPQDGRMGLAWLGLASGDLRVCEIAADALPGEIARIDPAELLLPDQVDLGLALRTPTSRLPVWHFETDTARETLLKQFGTASLDAFGCQDMALAIAAAGALLHYVKSTQGQAPSHIVGLRVESASETIQLDAATRRNLELTDNLRGPDGPTLLRVLDVAITSMGRQASK